MPYYIKPSSELRHNYNDIANICKSEHSPVFLTKNGEGDTVLMDIDSYNQREEDLACAQRLIDAQLARINGARGVSIDEFESSMHDAIAHGMRHAA